MSYTHARQPVGHHDHGFIHPTAAAAQIVLHRFVAACQTDARIVAAFLGGSAASGMADAYSDLDLGLITTDAAYADFTAQRAAFLRLLGEIVSWKTSTCLTSCSAYFMIEQKWNLCWAARLCEPRPPSHALPYPADLAGIISARQKKCVIQI
jgi:hypothetical protein